MNSRNYYENRLEEKEEDREPKNVQLIVELYNLLSPLEKVKVRKLLMCQQIF
jgi:hypothetical protein